MTQESQHAWRIPVEKSWGDDFKYEVGTRQYKNEEGKWCIMVMLTVKPSLIAKTTSTVVVNEVAKDKTSTIAQRSKTPKGKLSSHKPVILKLSPELGSQIHLSRLPKEFIITILAGKNGQDSRLMKIEKRSLQMSEEHPLVTNANKQIRRPRGNQQLSTTTAGRSAAKEEAKMRLLKEEERIRKNWEAQIWKKYGRVYDQLNTQLRRATEIDTEKDQW